MICRLTVQTKRFVAATCCSDLSPCVSALTSLLLDVNRIAATYAFLRPVLYVAFQSRRMQFKQ